MVNAGKGKGNVLFADFQLRIADLVGVRRTLVVDCSQAFPSLRQGLLERTRQSKVRRTLAEIGNWQSEIGNDLTPLKPRCFNTT
jgi:hypothetical protein